MALVHNPVLQLGGSRLDHANAIVKRDGLTKEYGISNHEMSGWSSELLASQGAVVEKFHNPLLKFEALPSASRTFVYGIFARGLLP